MHSANMMIETYAAESAILRARKIAGQQGEKEAELPVLMAQLNLHNALEKVAAEGREAIYSFAEGDDQRMLLMGLKRFTKVQNPVNIKELRRNIAAHVIEKGQYPL